MVGGWTLREQTHPVTAEACSGMEARVCDRPQKHWPLVCPLWPTSHLELGLLAGRGLEGITQASPPSVASAPDGPWPPVLSGQQILV